MTIRVLNLENRFSSTNVFFFFPLKNVIKNAFKNVCQKIDETKKINKIEVEKIDKLNIIKIIAANICEEIIKNADSF